jgi:hypothetical protein
MAPDTTAYFLLGLGVVTLVMGGLLARLIVRYRALRHDRAALEELLHEDQQHA